MNLYRIAFNNITRKKGRMLLTVSGLMAGIAIAVVLYITVDSMRLSLGDQIDEFGANIVIIPHTEGMEISYGGTHITNTSIDKKQLSEADLKNIATIPDYNSINIVSPKIVAAAEVNGRKVLLVGVEPEKEFIMKRWFSLSAQSNLAAGAVPGDLALLELPQNGLIAGANTAKIMNLNAGDSVEISGQKFVITGILNPLGSVEDGLLFGNLLAVQNFLGRPGEISMIELSAYCNSCPIEEIAAQLSEALPNGRVTALRQAALLREETIDRFSLFAFLLTAVILLIAALMVLTTMMSSVYERTREIGILRAIGFRGSHVMKVILLEAGLTGLLGGLAGFTVGTVVARYFGSYLAGTVVQVSWQISLLLPALALAIFIALAAAVIPAKRAANLDPVEALRFI